MLQLSQNAYVSPYNNLLNYIIIKSIVNLYVLLPFIAYVLSGPDYCSKKTNSSNHKHNFFFSILKYRMY